jgi:hypothetical protein
MKAASSKSPELAFTREDPALKRPSRTESWGRAVVFNPKNNSVDIRKISDVEEDVTSGILYSARCLPAVN